MLIEGNVVWLDFIRIWVPMFGCRRTRLHSPQSELFPDEEIMFPLAILFSSPDLFFTIFIHGSVGLWSDCGSFPKLAQVLLLSSFPYGWAFQVWSSAHFYLFLYGLYLKISEATRPRSFDLHLGYDLVALSCNVQRSNWSNMASSIPPSCLSIRFEGRFDLGFHR